MSYGCGTLGPDPFVSPGVKNKKFWTIKILRLKFWRVKYAS